MRKRSILVLLTTLTIGTAVPAAATPYGCGRNPQCGQYYVDANGDGICDNFVDNNGDGRNDNCPGYGNGMGPGCGNGQGLGQGQYNTPSAKTKNALRKFKKTKGLKANCIINTSTLKALRIS